MADEPQQWPGQPVAGKWPGQPVGTLQQTAPDPKTGEAFPFYAPPPAGGPQVQAPAANPAFPPQAKAAAQAVLPNLTDPNQMRPPGPPNIPATPGKIFEVEPPVDPRAQAAIYDIAGIAQNVMPFMPAAKVAAGIVGANIAERSVTVQKGVKEIQKFISPQSVSPVAGEAAATIRASGGRAARDTETTRAAVEAYRPTVNALPEPVRWDLVDYIEGGASTPTSTPALRSLADTLKGELEKRRAKLESLSTTADMDFIKDYLPHFWKDPKAAQNFYENYGRGPGKQGSGASTKKRTIPTYKEGIAAGLVPLTSDPIEMTMRYISSMDRFIASTEVLEQAKNLGTIKYFSPKSVGASGHPGAGHNVASSGPIPQGWVPIEGRGSVNALGQLAYAPEDWARVYNNYISRGFYELGEDWGRAVDAVQRTSNAITGLELGLSGYHAFTMANEAIISEVARSVSNIAGGKPIKGLTVLGKAPGAFITGAVKGKKLEQVYLGRSQGTPDMRRIMDLLAEAGGRGTGKTHASDYSFSPAGSFMTAWKRGALKYEMAQSLQNIKDRPIVGTAKETFKTIGRVMETVSQPLFEKYIPRLKNAAFYDLMHDWLAANPAATHAEQVAMARKIVDSVDNRFGEVIQYNIFWHKAMKQTAQIAMRSYSWNMGTLREIGGGTMKAVTDPRRLSLTHPDYDPRAAYVLAFAATVPLIGATYQYLKTGKTPDDVRDMLAPRTGGTAPGFAGRGEVEERAALPGYQKDVFGWYNDPVQEAKNKQSKLLSLTEELISGKDWRSHSIADPNASFVTQLGQYLKHVANSLLPISISQLMQGHKKGSNLGPASSMTGIRPAPGWLQDPEGTEKGLKALKARQYMIEQRSEARQKRQYDVDNQ